MTGADLATWDWEPATDRCVFNDRWADMLGVATSDVRQVFATWQASIHPEDLVAVGDSLADHVTGLAERFEAEYRIVRADGQVRWVHGRGKAVKRDTAGRPLRVTGTVLDITGHRLAQEALRESEERFRSLVDSMGDIVFTLDRQLLCEGVFGDWPARFGLAKDQILGRPVSELPVAEGHAQCESICRKALEGGHEFLEWTLSDARRPDGPARVRISPEGLARGLSRAW